MNSKQRRKQKRSAMRMSEMLIVIFAEALDDIERGKYTIPEMREQLNELKQTLAEVA